MKMVNPNVHGGCRSKRRVVRWVLVLACVCLVVSYYLGYFSPQDSCPSCSCDCTSKPIAPMSLDCGKGAAETTNEIAKSNLDLLSEELDLHKRVTEEKLKQSAASTMSAKETSWRYQREADKCNVGVGSCERARERAQQALAKEYKLTELWEKRARNQGWKESRLRLPLV